MRGESRPHVTAPANLTLGIVDGLDRRNTGSPMPTSPGASSAEASFQVHGLDFNTSRHFVLLTGTAEDRRKPRGLRGGADAGSKPARGRDAGELARAREPTTGRYVRRGGAQSSGPLETSPKFFTLHLDGEGCLQEGEPPPAEPFSEEAKERDGATRQTERKRAVRPAVRTSPSPLAVSTPRLQPSEPASGSRQHSHNDERRSNAQGSRSEKHRIEFLLSGDTDHNCVQPPYPKFASSNPEVQRTDQLRSFTPRPDGAAVAQHHARPAHTQSIWERARTAPERPMSMQPTSPYSPLYAQTPTEPPSSPTSSASSPNDTMPNYSPAPGFSKIQAGVIAGRAPHARSKSVTMDAARLETQRPRSASGHPQQFIGRKY